MAVASADATYWSHNFTMPTYKQFITDVFSAVFDTCSKLKSSEVTPVAWVQTVKAHGYFSWRDFQYFVGLAIFWTVLRYIVTALIFKPLVTSAKLGKSETRKAPESMWKFIFYSSTWGYSVKLLFFSDYDFFFNPPLTFYKWKIGHDVPGDIYAFYMVQLSFYLHSVYGTLFMDVWRKDSNVMLLHHYITLMLIGFSYAFRFTNIGILVLFLHDITDIFLEFTKTVLYHKKKGGWWTTVCDVVSSVGFVGFGISWFVFRLYWFPLKAMYAAGYAGAQLMTEMPPFYLFFNGLLWILLCMNIYWFKFIVVMAYKVITGNATEGVEDVREYSSDNSSDEGSPKRAKPVANGHQSQNGTSKKQR